MHELEDLQSLRVSGDVPGHAAESLTVTVHCGPGAGALRRARLAVRAPEHNQEQDGHQQPPRSLQEASGAQSSHHHCGKRGARGDPHNAEKIQEC